MNDDIWTGVMDEATELAAQHGLEFHELRNAWGALMVAQDADFYKDQGVTSSDMNHMLYSAMLHDLENVKTLATQLGADKAERTRIVNAVAESAGIHPDMALQQLREFFAPVES